MRLTGLTIPELAVVDGARAAAGLGWGLLLADHLPAKVRRPVGWTLVLVGVPSTLAIDVIELAVRAMGGIGECRLAGG